MRQGAAFSLLENMHVSKKKMVKTLAEMYVMTLYVPQCCHNIKWDKVFASVVV